MSSNYWLPNILALEITTGLNNKTGEDISTDQFCDLVEVISSFENELKQRSAVKVLKSLSKTDLLIRIKKLIKLNSLLNLINKNARR